MTNKKLTNRQAIGVLDGLWSNPLFGEAHRQAFEIGIMAIKALEQEPKTGHWIAEENEEMETIGYYCSECDLPMETENQTRFCPNCGAKMEVSDGTEI